MSILFLTLIFSVFFVSCNNKDENDFRNMKWGMTLEEVKATEKGIADESSVAGALFYDVEVSELPCTLVYTSSKDKGVINAMYNFDIYEIDDEAVGIAYSALQEEYENKYGKPKAVTETWLNERYKDSPVKYWKAISAGDLEIETSWETNTTNIKLYVKKNDSSKVKVSAFYSWNKAYEKNNDNI